MNLPPTFTHPRGGSDGEAAQHRARSDAFVRIMVAITLISVLTISSALWTRYGHRGQPSEGGSTLPKTSGPALVAIYVGSSDCHGSSLPEFPEVEQRTMAALARYAERNGMRFVRVGVSVDASPTAGRAYLKRLGPFDAISVGGGWLNPVAVSYIWRDQPSDGIIPQIVVVRRIVSLTQSGPLVSPDSLLGRLVGIDGMQQWLRQQAN